MVYYWFLVWVNSLWYWWHSPLLPLLPCSLWRAAWWCNGGWHWTSPKASTKRRRSGCATTVPTGLSPQILPVKISARREQFLFYRGFLFLSKCIINLKNIYILSIDNFFGGEIGRKQKSGKSIRVPGQPIPVFPYYISKLTMVTSCRQSRYFYPECSISLLFCLSALFISNLELHFKGLLNLLKTSVLALKQGCRYLSNQNKQISNLSNCTSEKADFYGIVKL